MLALVSLINPIRSFGEKSRLVHILLIATHALSSGRVLYLARW